MNIEKTTLPSNLLKFHHIGVATSSVENASKFYLEMGYSKSETFNDPIQKVNICFMQKKRYASNRADRTRFRRFTHNQNIAKK